MRLLGTITICAIFTTAATSYGQVEMENFDGDPLNWARFGQPTAFCGVCDFGFSNTNNAGGSAGEGGGTMSRLNGGANPNEPVSYGVSLGGAFTLDDNLTFTADIFDSEDTEPQFGFYTEGTLVSNGIDPASFLGLAPDVGGNTYIKVYGPGAGDSTSGNPDNPSSPYNIVLTYDPAVGTSDGSCPGGVCGQISTVFDGGEEHLTNLTPASRNSGVQFTHFGLNILGDPNASGFRTGTFYFDNLTYSSKGGEPPVIATRFNWNASALGNWENGNWAPQGGVAQGERANSPNHTAVFPSNITEATNVSTMLPVTLNRIEFDNSAISYVVSGLGSVNMASTTAPSPVTPTMSVVGTHRFQAAVNLHNDTSINVGSASQLVFDGALDLGGATLTKTGIGDLAIRNDLITGGGGTVNLREGSLSGNGTVDGDVTNDGGTVSPGNNSSLASQVPEPGTCVLLLVGLLGLGAWWSRHRMS